MTFIYYFIRLLVAPLFLAGLFSIAFVTATYFYYLPQTPSVSALRDTQLNLPLRVYSKDDELIAEFGEYRRRPVVFDQVPDNLLNAFISIEDSRFYTHKGVDFRGVARAVVSALEKGRVTEGASTITMQVARNFYLSNTRTLDRKLREVLLALKIEDEMSKEEILELYMNKIFLGKRSYGVGSAAEIYYGKKIEDLTLAQSAMIAGLPKAPSAYNPITNPERAKTRRDYILKRMSDLNYITESDYKTAVSEELSATIHNVETETYAPYMAEMARNDAIKRFGEENIYKLGLNIYTTLDSAEQDNAISTLRNNLLKYTKRHGYLGPEGNIDLDTVQEKESQQASLKEYKVFADLYPALVTSVDDKEATLEVYKQTEPVKLSLKEVDWARKYINENKRGSKPKTVSEVLNLGDIIRVSKDDEDKWTLSQLPKVTGALVSMNPQNGAIEAIAGGFDFTYSKFNRAIQAKRQPGSSFKPFIYAAALAKGFSPASTIEDKALNLANSNWRPRNYGHEESGLTRLRPALAKSKNLVSIRLLQEIGIGYAIEYAKRFGFKELALPDNLTLSLGTGSATPLEMATAYSSFANGGYKVESHFIRKIIDKNDNVIFEADPITVCPTCLTRNSKEVNHPAKRIMKPAVHYQITSMLQSVAQSGTAARTNRLKRKDLGGKTGTTDDQKDAWFCGFSPEKVTTVWVGFDKIAPLGRKETATGAALPIWIDFMRTALKDTKQGNWKVPRGLINVELDAESGMPPNEFTLDTIVEKLTPNQIPTEEEILAYMETYKEELLLRQQILEQQEYLEFGRFMEEGARQRQEDRLQREAFQREENARRREDARLREIERLRQLGIEPPDYLFVPQTSFN